jgi:hypothetical protein
VADIPRARSAPGTTDKPIKPSLNQQETDTMLELTAIACIMGAIINAASGRSIVASACALGAILALSVAFVL